METEQPTNLHKRNINCTFAAEIEYSIAKATHCETLT